MQKCYELLKIATFYLYCVCTDRQDDVPELATTALCHLTRIHQRACHAHGSLSTLAGPKSRPHFFFVFLESVSAPLGPVCVYILDCVWRTQTGMAELEGLEFGKSDFVLLDEVTMEQFMENLKLR